MEKFALISKIINPWLTHRRDKKCIQKIWMENLKGRDHLKTYGKIINIRMDLREIELEDVDWIHVAQERDQWRTLVKVAMNLWVP
jgi:hypothetical protein